MAEEFQEESFGSAAIFDVIFWRIPIGKSKGLWLRYSLLLSSGDFVSHRRGVRSGSELSTFA